MPSDPPALPPWDRECPLQAGRTASGGFPALCSILFCLLLSGLAPCPASAAQPAPAQQLVAAAPANMPPFFVPAADGSPEGFAVELLRRVAAQAGYSLRLMPTSTLAEAEQLLRQGRVQAVPGLGVSPVREQALGFTQPFELLPVHIFYRASAPPLETLESLAGKRLALVAGSIPAERLLDRSELSIHLTQTLAEAIFEVLSGQADALVFLAPAVQHAARAAGVEQILGRSKRPLFEIGRAFAVGRDNPQLQARLNTALGAFLDTQEFRDLYLKWHPTPRPAQFSPVALWTMAALALGLTAALLAWRAVSLLRVNRRLKLAVTERDQALAAQGLTEERLEALFTLAHMDAASTGELMDFALEQGVRLTGSRLGYLLFVEDEDPDRCRAIWSRTAREQCSSLPKALTGAAFTISQGGLWAECLHTGIPSIINNYPAHPGRRALPEGHSPILRHMGVPLMENGQALVMFGVGDKPAPYDDTDARQLQLFLSGLWRVLKARRDADAIRQAKDYAESLLQGANAMVVGLDRLGRVTVFNAAAEELTGFARAELLGRDWFTALYPRFRAQAIASRYRRIMAGQAPLARHDETPLCTKDGRTRLISWQNSLLFQGGPETGQGAGQGAGDITGLIAFGIDITERKQAEEALQVQNDENLTLLNGVPAMIFYKSLDNRILRANEAWFRIMGLDESMLGVPLKNVYPRDLAEKVHRDDREIFASGQAKMNIQETILTPTGLRRFTTHKLPRRDAKGVITGLVCIATDVTDLRQAEAALAESAEEFRTLAEDSPALICRFLPGGILTYVNRAFCATFGRTAHELLGSSLLALVPAEERTAVLARLGSFTSAVPVAVAEQKMLLPGGRLGWQQWTDRALFDPAGGIIAYQSVGMDISALKQSEIDLRRLHRAIEQTAEGVLITDKDGVITYTNPALERMTGLGGAGRAPGLSVLEVRQTVLAHRDSVVRQDEGGGWRGTSSFARQNGQNVEVEFTISAIRDAEGEVISFVAVCRDVTEKRLLERQLWQAQKMEALGTLAGGIAHDFNNILASIMGFTELALDDTPPGGRARGSLARVLKASNRAKELVRQILTFSRRADREQRTLLADQIIGEALRLMEATLPKNIEITAQVQAADCAILADPSQIHQIVMNLCTNAAQAMCDGGRMAVRTWVAHLDKDAPAQARTLAPGQYLRLTVEDSGSGIAPDVLGRIFEPFFTTKDSGEGTGLGLAVVHGIVTSLGGAVYAESKPGQGAAFTVLLPTVAAGQVPALRSGQSDQASKAAQTAHKGRERILLVDDEADLLDMVAQTLEPLGYQVDAHNLPEDALRAFLASPKSFDLVLTDQSMPRLTGLQLVTRLREVRPDLPIVLCTGLSLVIPPDRFQALGQAWLLPKPFSTAELAQVVRQALASTQGGAHAT